MKPLKFQELLDTATVTSYGYVDGKRISKTRVDSNQFHLDFLNLGEEGFNEFINEVQELQHHKDTTLGLWATDKPELIQDSKKVLFRL